MAQEARLFRALHQQRSQQCAKACAEAAKAEAEADEAEAALVFTLDRACFAAQQLNTFAASGAAEELPLQRVLEEHSRQLAAMEQMARQHQALVAELGGRRRRAAAAVARLRLLRSLCALCGPGAGAAQSLASLLWRCEEALLAEGGRAAGAMPRPPLEVLAAELEAASPVSLVLPLLQPSPGRSSREPEAQADAPSASAASGLGARGRWLLAPARPAPSEAEQEEAGLRRAAEDLAERQRELRAELREVREEGRRREAAAAAGAREARRRCWAEAAGLRRELADCYERLAELDEGALEEELSSLRASYEEARAEHAFLEVATETKEKLAPTAASAVGEKAPSGAPRPEASPAPSSRGGPPAESDRSSLPSRQSSSSAAHSPSGSPGGSPRPASDRSARVAKQFARLKSAEFAALQRHGSATLRRIRPDPADPGIGSQGEAAKGVPAASPRPPASATAVEVLVEASPASSSGEPAGPAARVPVPVLRRRS